MSAVSGLAASIRSSVESETFDLGGSTAATIQTTIENAFSEPFPFLPSMIRLTFVTGAGKLGRAKYDDGAAKAVTGTLRELGYVEDRGASAVMECAGSFKMQHDTGKNLKTVVVFPRMDASDGGDLANAVGNLSFTAQGQSLLAEGSIEHKVAMASKEVFAKMLDSKCQTWTQRKGCAMVLTELKAKAEDIDSKLLSGQPLNDAEQAYYDSISLSVLEEKIAITRESLQAMVDAGTLNQYDRTTLLDQVSERILTLDKDIVDAKKLGKSKRIENLQAAKSKAENRKAKILSISPIPLPPLKFESEISKLRKEMEPILSLEAAAKGRLLTLKESQAVSRKDELLEEISEHQNASQGWFEPSELFQARLAASDSAWQSQRKKAVPKKKVASAEAKNSSTGATKWVTPGSRKQGAWQKPAKKTAKTTPGGLFAAMMEDSDSD